MTININGSVKADDKVRRYVEKVIGTLEKYLPRTDREQAHAYVTLDQVNRAHGNKYEAAVRLEAGGLTLEERDSTLNVLAALDIVRAKLAEALTSR